CKGLLDHHEGSATARNLSPFLCPLIRAIASSRSFREGRADHRNRDAVDGVRLLGLRARLTPAPERRLSGSRPSLSPRLRLNRCMPCSISTTDLCAGLTPGVAIGRSSVGLARLPLRVRGEATACRESRRFVG